MRVLLPLAVLAALVVPSASLARAPQLVVADASPLTVKGSGFAARERIKVSASLPGTTAHWTTSTVSGAFTVHFSTSADSCTAYIVHAAGLRGDTAVLRIRPPECPQGPTP